ncbi:MAG: hypothetical protein F9B45_28970 [Phycisphaera sp. RhM]|nr:hypothetical protein [Phycisphaera sp. RhM]
MNLTLPPTNLRGRKRTNALAVFGKGLTAFSSSLDLGFKISSRGWCYIFENHGFITKSEFARVEKVINDCRKLGLIDPKFTADDSARSAVGVESLDYDDPSKEAKWLFDAVIEGRIENYTPRSFWEELDIYIEIVVEKIDLVGLFEPLARKYHIPITNARGWADINSRIDLGRRMVAHKESRKIVLYCADHDPAGLFIESAFAKNLDDIKLATGWTPNEDPSFSVHRFGLNFEFIQENQLSWIDNLETSSGKDLADPRHKSHLTYRVPEYINQFGARKVEANALVVNPAAGRELLESAIRIYIPDSYVEAYESARSMMQTELRAEVVSYAQQLGAQQ